MRLLAPFLLVLVPLAAHALTVRVDPAGGAPRLCVDGKPVRARMFWGASAGSPLAVRPEASELAFEFTALEDEPERATVHFRFGSLAGDVYLDDLRVHDLATGRDVLPACAFEGGDEDFTREWSSWPTGEANTVATVAVEPNVGRDGSGGLHVRLTDPPNGKWPDWHIYHRASLALERGHRYRVSAWVQAQPERSVVIALYRPGDPYVFLGGPPGVFEQQIALAAEVGVDLVSFPVPMPWPKLGEAEDWRSVDAACEQVLGVNPKALLLPRIGLYPPPWWYEAHPEERMTWDDGSQEDWYEVASPVYRRDAAERLRALIEHLEEAFGDQIAGYHPCGQHTGEWFYARSWVRALNGYSPSTARAWRAWLRERYPTDAALQAAWSDPAARLDKATVPSAESRYAAPNGLLRDPATERAIIDFNAFQQQMMGDCVLELARVAREASRGEKLVIFFYGYGFEFGALPTCPATSGHYALRSLLSSPDIDVLCSPISYFDRGLGQSAPAMTAAESVALAGKMWLNEDDTATYLSTGTPPGSADRVKTLEETNQQLVRNVGQEALRNFGTWWMDLLATGWFNDRGMWAEMERLRALDEALLAGPTPYRPPIAAVIDEASMVRMAGGASAMAQAGIYEVRRALARTGAPYGQYLLDDVLAGKVEAEVYVFLNAWYLTADQRRALRAATRDKTCVWCYAPGAYDGDRLSRSAMQELTGFDLQPVTPENALAWPTPEGNQLGVHKAFGSEHAVRPLFCAYDAPPEERWAAYADGSQAVARRRMDWGLSVFVGAPGLTSELLRAACRETGVHLFTETDCNVWASGPFIVLHAPQTGEYVVHVGANGPVTDVLTGEVIGQGPRLTLHLQAGQTQVLRRQ